MAQRESFRCVHDKNLSPRTNATLYEHGQKQAVMSTQYYHYLCAAIQQKYEVTTVPADFSQGQMFPRAGLVFTAYKTFKLEPVLGIKLHPRPDGTIHPGDIKHYVDMFRSNWKCREGGILRCIDEQREFWNIILNYHSTARTTGMQAWDRLFDRLKRNSFDKGMIPCMWFAREAGCCDPKCEFLHDKEACERNRCRVLEKRRATLGKPTMRDIGERERRAIRAHHASQRQVVPVSGLASATSEEDKDALQLWDDDDDDDEEEDVDPEVRKIFDERTKVRKICNNPKCLTIQMKKNAREEANAPDIKMMCCSRCKVATYCSAECQSADWKRHKKEPCRPFEELVEDDDLWNEFGQRVGTGMWETRQ